MKHKLRLVISHLVKPVMQALISVSGISDEENDEINKKAGAADMTDLG